MTQKLRGRSAAASLFVALGLLLAACSGSGVDQAATDTAADAPAAECGEWELLCMHGLVTQLVQTL